MEKTVKKSRLAGVPAWALSLLTSFATIGYVIIESNLAMKRELADQGRVFIGPVRLSVFSDFMMFIVIIPTVIFIICRTHPKSVWYTPVLANAYGLGMGCMVLLSFIFHWDPISFSDWLLWGGTCVLSITGAIIGARTGRRRIHAAK